jgi:hypothetical protein
VYNENRGKNRTKNSRKDRRTMHMTEFVTPAEYAEKILAFTEERRVR